MLKGFNGRNDGLPPEKRLSPDPQPLNVARVTPERVALDRDPVPPYFCFNDCHLIEIVSEGARPIDLQPALQGEQCGRCSSG